MKTKHDLGNDGSAPVRTGHNVYRTREGFLLVCGIQDRGFGPVRF